MCRFNSATVASVHKSASEGYPTLGQHRYDNNTPHLVNDYQIYPCWHAINERPEQSASCSHDNNLSSH